MAEALYDRGMGGPGRLRPEDPGFSKSGAYRQESPWSGKFFKWFLGIASLFLVVELIWFVGVTPFRPFSKIEISGFSDYDSGSLLAYAGLTPQSSFVVTDVKEIKTLLSDLPQIESVRVFKRFPDRLDIHIQSRQAAALTFTDIEGVTIPILMDRQGVIFQIGAVFSRDDYTELPVVSGLLQELPVLGMRLPARICPFLEQLELIKAKAPEILSAVSEIRFDRNAAEGYDLTLYLQHQKTKVLLSGLNEELLRYTLLVADVLIARDPEIGMIDFRGGMASYYPKGGSSE